MMRKELNLIEHIERYLLGELSPEELKIFEEKLLESKELQGQVENQKILMEGIKRLALKPILSKAYTTYKFNKNLPWLLSGVLSLAIIAFIIWQYNPDETTRTDLDKQATETNIIPIEPNGIPNITDTLESVNPPKTVGNGIVQKLVNDSKTARTFSERKEDDVESRMPSNTYRFDANNDTVIETTGGMLVVIPANTFLDRNGRPARGKIDLKISEALTANDIIKSGLSTMSGNQMLETAGMFSVRAFQNNQELTMAKKGIYMEVPTNEVKKDMQLYEGVKLENGKIDWQNPREMNPLLIPVDMLSLDFYPPEYLAKLVSLSKDITNKVYTDSLYYSFAFQYTDNISDSLRGDGIAFERVYGKSGLRRRRTEEPGIEGMSLTIEGLYPSKVKTIWNRTYNNTILATREFEMRMPAIHNACDDWNAILDLYVSNVNQRLSYIDSLVFKQIKPVNTKEFYAFSQMNHGKVKDGKVFSQAMKDYYQLKGKAIRNELIKIQEDYWNEQQRLDKITQGKTAEWRQKERKRKQDNFDQEWEINYEEAMRQLGYTITAYRSIKRRYSFSIRSSGTYNLDRAVTLSLIKRETLNYKGSNGRRAIIKYKKFSIEITNSENYDRIDVYLLPDKLNSFMRVSEKQHSVFSENLNELIDYDLLVIAFKGKDVYFSEMKRVEAKDYKLKDLKIISESKLEKKLNNLNKTAQSNDLNYEFAYQKFQFNDKIRRDKNQQIIAFRNEIKAAVFPCWYIPSSKGD